MKRNKWISIAQLKLKTYLPWVFKILTKLFSDVKTTLKLNSKIIYEVNLK